MNKNHKYIREVLGMWGRWQLRSTLLIYLCKIPSSWFMACIIFTAPSPTQIEITCSLKNSNTEIASNAKFNQSAVIMYEHENWHRIMHPHLIEPNDRQFNVDFCDTQEDAEHHARIFNANIHHVNDLVKHASIPCDTFSHQPYYHTKVTKYDLICSRNMVAAITQFFHLFGILVGGILAIKVLKYLSPRRLMLGGMVSQIGFGIMIAFVSNYKLHLLLKTLCAISCAQMFTAGHSILGDITGGTYRTATLCFFDIFWSIGVFLLPAVASTFQSMTNIYLAISCPTALYIILWGWIPDSPIWLFEHGEVKELSKMLIDAAKINKRSHQIPKDVTIQLHVKWNSRANENDAYLRSWFSLWTSGYKRTVTAISAHITWGVCVVLFNGMLLNIRSFGQEYLYRNVMITGLIEMFGVLIGWLLLMKTTRKWMWSGLFNIFAGVFTALAWAIPYSINESSKGLFLLGCGLLLKASISCSQAMLIGCTAELVPAHLGYTLTISCIIFARICLLTAPFIGSLTLIHYLLPISVFGFVGSVGGFTMCILNSERTIPRCKDVKEKSSYDVELLT